ncbi:MAG TPA: hypothetical protein DD381_10560 [Lentisphaeria bacterium]|nr:MAG: hypothetical protein A2X47_02110 [Lentisphaerae bacterium GWF2_38_69]HBM16768.1 hypothetical protein [Lentisphaeria bacterium]
MPVALEPLSTIAEGSRSPAQVSTKAKSSLLNSFQLLKLSGGHQCQKGSSSSLENFTPGNFHIIKFLPYSPDLILCRFPSEFFLCIYTRGKLIAELGLCLLKSDSKIP